MCTYCRETFWLPEGSDGGMCGVCQSEEDRYNEDSLDGDVDRWVPPEVEVISQGPNGLESHFVPEETLPPYYDGCGNELMQDEDELCADCREEFGIE